MLQNILKIDGISPLDKTAQKDILGGSPFNNPCDYYAGPLCFSDNINGCGSCQEYWALPADIRDICVLADMDCLEFYP
jgi:hypothetical protein